MLSEKQKRDALDEIVAKGGGLAGPKRPLIVDADYRAMSRYCTEKGVKPMDLTEEEYAMFRYDEPLVYN